MQSCILLSHSCHAVTDPVIVEAGREELNLANKRMNQQIRGMNQQISDLMSEFSTVVLLHIFANLVLPLTNIHVHVFTLSACYVFGYMGQQCMHTR